MVELRTRIRRWFTASQTPAPAAPTLLHSGVGDEREAQRLWWLWARCYLPAKALDLALRTAAEGRLPSETTTEPSTVAGATEAETPTAPAPEDAPLAQWLDGLQGKERQP